MAGCWGPKTTYILCRWLSTIRSFVSLIWSWNLRFFIIFHSIFFCFFGTNRNVSSCSYFIEFSLTMRTLLIWGIFIWNWLGNAISTLILDRFFTNSSSKLEGLLFPFRHLCHSSFNRFIFNDAFFLLSLSFLLGFFLLKFFLFFIFLH